MMQPPSETKVETTKAAADQPKKKTASELLYPNQDKVKLRGK